MLTPDTLLNISSTQHFWRIVLINQSVLLWVYLLGPVLIPRVGVSASLWEASRGNMTQKRTDERGLTHAENNSVDGAEV